ncbi:MAG: glutathione peroxidase [Thiohalomonadaceae bacterium]
MPANREGQRVPDVVFKTRHDDRWVDVTTAEVFGGRTIAAFALPGAFTPTCSSAHLPRFNELAPLLRANGVDEIVCISVNDAHVMNAWQKQEKADRVRMLPDGNGDFAAGMGMLVDMRHLGYGWRSWRYSMLVRDGVIEKMFIEPEKEGDPYEVSDADTLLRYINPEAREPPPITMITREGCPYCARARRMLEERGYGWDELVLGVGISERGLRALSGTDVTPQVFIGGEHIGDSEALAAYLAAH